MGWVYIPIVSQRSCNGFTDVDLKVGRRIADYNGSFGGNRLKGGVDATSQAENVQHLIRFPSYCTPVSPARVLARSARAAFVRSRRVGVPNVRRGLWMGEPGSRCIFRPGSWTSALYGADDWPWERPNTSGVGRMFQGQIYMLSAPFSETISGRARTEVLRLFCRQRAAVLPRDR